jgi:hypothetical protein
MALIKGKKYKTTFNKTITFLDYDETEGLINCLYRKNFITMGINQIINN